jgi:hypothetical protein
MPAGRPPLGPELVDRLGTTEEAKTRLKAILETMTGMKTVEDACAQLDISESRFHELKSIALTAAAVSLEPAPRGRPRKQDDPAAGELEQMKQKIAELEQELIFAKARAVVATAFPHLIKDPNTEKKKNPRDERRKRRRAQRKRRGM